MNNFPVCVHTVLWIDLELFYYVPLRPRLQIGNGGIFLARVGLRRSGASPGLLPKMELGDILKSHHTPNSIVELMQIQNLSQYSSDFGCSNIVLVNPRGQ